MKKEEFLKLLKERLIERGVPEDIAEKETQHVHTYLSESGMEELDVSIDEMADGIMSMLDDGGGSEETAEVQSAPFIISEKEIESVSDELKAAIEAIEEPVSENKEASSDSETLPETDETPKPDDTVPPAENEEIQDDAGAILIDTPPAHVHEEPKPAEEGEPEDIEDYIPIEKKKKMKNNVSLKKTDNAWLYVTLLVITIPIAIALILLAALIYLGFWVALALAMIGCIALLVVFVAAGSIVSLVGIVYGVVELITGLMPAGLFEIGLGIIVGAAVMFIGILIYNFAVRLIPFGMKLLAKLFKMGFNGLRTGYQMLKGAVANI